MEDSDLQQAERLAKRFSRVYRTISTREGVWRRGGNLVRVKLIDLDAAMPAGIDAADIVDFKVVSQGSRGWEELAHHVDYADGSGRRREGQQADANTWLCFHAPETGTAGGPDWPGADAYDGSIDLTLWDSRDHARCDGVSIFYRVKEQTTLGRCEPRLKLVEDDTGWSVMVHDVKRLHFAGNRGWQIDFACTAKERTNLVPEGRTWRWMPTETTEELVGGAADRVTFRPCMTEGPVATVELDGESRAGAMSATLRIFEQEESLILEFSDYRARRRRPELPPEQHERSYAGQYASPYPDAHYAALMVEGPADSTVRDHLYKYETVDLSDELALVYDGDRKQCGWNWLALEQAGGVVGVSTHGRSHYPDHPFKAGRVAARTIVALEPFGSEVDGHYESCDRYMLIVTDSTDRVRECFDTLDTFSLLAQPPLRRELAFLDSYDCVRQWVNLSLDYLMKDRRYRYSVNTDGQSTRDADTCLVPIDELMRLYEKTGFEPLGQAAAAAANHVADWLLSARIYTRGEGVGPNGGGIYQSELIYLMLALARVYRWSKAEVLKTAIDRANQWMLDQRGGLGTWGWENYLWHAGAWDATGKPLYYWPVNANQFATVNFRLHQMLGTRTYYDQAMTIMEDYLAHLPRKSWEIIRGGGVSDTTRGVHLFAEVLEVAGNDPRIDKAFWREALERTQDRFWVEGWPLVRHSMYAEAMWPGTQAPEIFSPGFRHWHNCGSPLDIIPRIAVAAEVGVSEWLTRWAVRDLALDFDARFGLEEHTHMARYSIRDTDIEPASWLDCELLPMLYAVKGRGWIADDDFRLLHYKIHQLVQRSFLSLDTDHGGWAPYYDAQSGEPIKYLNWWEQRHSFERFRDGEPKQIVGLIIRDAYYDHSSHYWHAPEQLIDELLTMRTCGLKDGVQHVRAGDDGLGAGLLMTRPAMVAKEKGATDICVDDAAGCVTWRIQEQRTVLMAGQEFWLLACRKEKEGLESCNTERVKVRQ